MNTTPVHIRCESIDKYREIPTNTHNSSAISRSKEILLFKNWSNNVTVANHYAESFIPHQVQCQCYTGLCFFRFKNLANALQKHFEYDQINI